MHYYIASYDSIPTIYELSRNQGSYQLTPHHTNSIPSYLINDERYIYVANKSGGISIYTHDLQLVDEYIDIHSYTHICVNGHYIVTVSYRDGITSIFYFDETLSKLAEYQHRGSHLDPHGRQESSHPHFIVPINETTYLICDLGRNALVEIEYDGEYILEKRVYVFEDICGPRHLHFVDESHFLLVNEVSNTVLYMTYPDFHIVSTLALGEDTTKLSTITHSLSAIRYDAIHDTFYISDRNHYNTSYVWIIRISNNELTIDSKIEVGKHPRDIYIDNNTLIVGCMNDDSIEIYNTKTKQLLKRIENVSTPVCILKNGFTSK